MYIHYDGSCPYIYKDQNKISGIIHSHSEKNPSVSGLKGCLAYWKTYKKATKNPEECAIAAAQISIHESLLKEARFAQIQAAVTFRGTRRYLFG